MLADSMVAAGPVAAFTTIGAPIILEVTLPGKELVFVVEIDLIQPAEGESEPPPPAPTGDHVAYAGNRLAYGGNLVTY